MEAACWEQPSADWEVVVAPSSAGAPGTRGTSYRHLERTLRVAGPGWEADLKFKFRSEVHPRMDAARRLSGTSGRSTRSSTANSGRVSVGIPHGILRECSDTPHFFTPAATHLMDSKRHTPHRKEKPPCQFIPFGPSFVSCSAISQPRNPQEGRNISFHTRPSRVLQQTPGTPRRALLFACCTEIGGHVANPAWSAGARESGSIASARGDNRGAPVATHETTWGVHSRLGCSGP